MNRLVRRALMAIPTLRITSAAPEPLAEEEVCPNPPGYELNLRGVGAVHDPTGLRFLISEVPL